MLSKHIPFPFCTLPENGDIAGLLNVVTFRIFKRTLMDVQIKWSNDDVSKIFSCAVYILSTRFIRMFSIVNVLCYYYAARVFPF